MALSLLVAAPAWAGPNVDSSAALRPCIRRALDVRAAWWVCTPAGLTAFARSPVGTTTASFAAVAPGVPARADPAMAGDHDNWCENGSVCRRPAGGPAAEEIKTNVAYGNEQGVIGSFDVVLRARPDGRHATWNVSLIWDSGPDLTFGAVTAGCRRSGGARPDRDCGTARAGTASIGGGRWQWTSAALAGSRPADGAAFHCVVAGRFRASGYAYPFSAGLSRSGRFAAGPTGDYRRA